MADPKPETKKDSQSCLLLAYLKNNDVNYDLLFDTPNYFSKVLDKQTKSCTLGKHRDVRKQVHDMIVANPTKASRILMSLLKITHDDITKPVTIVPFTRFYVFGCPLSRDIDVLCIVENKEDVNKSIDELLLRKRLTLLGYDEKREIDASLAYAKDGSIIISSVGTCETQNIVVSTIDYHKQEFPPILHGLKSINITERVFATAKYVMDKLKILFNKTEEFQDERETRRTAYEGGEWSRVDYTLSLFKKLGNYPENEAWRSIMKSITMKIVQTILHKSGDYEYTKLGLVKKFVLLYAENPNILALEQGVLWFLLRGTKGTFSAEAKKFLFDEFTTICADLKNRLI